MSTPSSAAPDLPAHTDPVVIRTSIAVIVGAIAVIFDTTIVSVALHQLSIDLEAPVETIQWVSTGYLLALGVSIPLVAWLQSLLGGKRLWMAALTVFLVGSALCSVAWDAPSLIGFRVLQGLGGGALFTLMTTLIVQAARGRDLGRLMATVALPTSLGPILGPVIGGLILIGGDWRWLFLVNIPLGIAGLVLAWRLIPRDEPGPRVKLDVVGFLLLSPALVALLWGLSNASADGGFTRPDVYVPVLGGALLLAAFVAWALRRKAAAIVDLAILRNRSTWSSTALMFLMGAALYGSMLLLPLYWQQLRGMDALGAGLLLISQGVGTLVTRTLAPRLMELVGARTTVMIGFAVSLLATIPFAFADGTTSIVWLEAALLVRGFGLGLVFIPIMSVAFVGLERAKVPHASVITRVAQQIGGSVGVALLAVILAGAAGSAGSAVAGFQVAFWWAVGFTAVALLIALVLPNRSPIAAASRP